MLWRVITPNQCAYTRDEVQDGAEEDGRDGGEAEGVALVGFEGGVEFGGFV